VLICSMSVSIDGFVNDRRARHAATGA